MTKLTHDGYGFSLHHVRLGGISHISIEDGYEVICTLPCDSTTEDSKQLCEEFFSGELS
jgi:hypothetical protein